MTIQRPNAYRAATIGFIFSLIIEQPALAFAYAGPGELAFTSIFSLTILIVALTFAGGGYQISRRLNKKKFPSNAKRFAMNAFELIAGILLFFAAIITTIWGVTAFALFAIIRGLKLVNWGRTVTNQHETPDHLVGVSSARLKLAGSVLIVFSISILSYSLLHFDKTTGISDYRKKGHVHLLNTEASKAHAAAMQFLQAHPKTKMVSCTDLEKTGYQPAYKEVLSCDSNMTLSSGEIRITGPASWGLTKPTAVITFSGELDAAKP